MGDFSTSKLSSMLAHIKTFGQNAAQIAAEKAAIFAETVTAQSKTSLEYEIGPEVGAAGPDGIWRIHRARPVREHPGNIKSVSVWIMNKTCLQNGSSPGSKSISGILEQDIRQVNLLKHPGVVRILEPLESTKTQYIIVTEEVIGSLDSWLAGRCRIQENDSEPLYDLEIKHGLKKVAETLQFMHGSCKRVHCNLSTESIIIAADGTWKLAGLGLSQVSCEGARLLVFDGCLYLSSSSSPELVESLSEAPITGAADSFSLACVAYRVFRKQPLFTAQTTSEYRGTLASMNLLPIDGLPSGTQGWMRGMLKENNYDRPPLQAFLDSAYIRDDRLLRALCFLDDILQRETAQKHAFMRDLPTFLGQIPPRILRRRVLPVMLSQWQDDSLRDAVLPLVLRMVKNVPVDIFQDQVLPELQKIFVTANGAQLLAVLEAVPDLQQAMRVEQVEDVLMPVLLNGLTGQDTHIQERVLVAMKEPLKRIRAQCMHNRVLPSVMKTCVNTKSVSVCTACLQTLRGIAPRLTEQECDVCARMIKQLTSVEASDVVLSHILQVCEEIGNTKGAAYVANTIVPLVTPLLTAKAMTSPTFARFMTFLRNMLDKIEQRMHSQRSSNTASINGGAVTWDEVPKASNRDHYSTVLMPDTVDCTGLGPTSDMISDWSTPVTRVSTSQGVNAGTAPLGSFNSNGQGSNNSHDRISGANSSSWDVANGLSKGKDADVLNAVRSNGMLALQSGVTSITSMNAQATRVQGGIFGDNSSKASLSQATQDIFEPMGVGLRMDISTSSKPTPPVSSFPGHGVSNSSRQNLDPFADLLSTPQVTQPNACSNNLKTKPPTTIGLQSSAWDPFA